MLRRAVQEFKGLRALKANRGGKGVLVQGFKEIKELDRKVTRVSQGTKGPLAGKDTKARTQGLKAIKVIPALRETKAMLEAPGFRAIRDLKDDRVIRVLVLQVFKVIKAL